jgi:hypothetical protein
MSKLFSTRDARIKEKLDRLFGNSPQAEELKAIALKAQTTGLTDEDIKEYWEEKEKEIAELKERMPDVGDLALPVQSVTFYGDESQVIVNGTVDVSGEREDGGHKNPSIKHEVVCGDITERGQEVTCNL